MMEINQLDTHQKALTLNLDPSIYGSIAEIGAGQEVSRWFFQVGATSGSIAKTISAYDMKVSDEIYGKAGRYVSLERIIAMVEYEYAQLIGRLKETRGNTTKFFAFANTISARNFQGTNIPHGWIGLMFQSFPESPPNRMIIHVNLLDETNQQQQEAIGILGVNMIYGAYHEIVQFDIFLKNLLHCISGERLEIDYMNLDGPLFQNADQRLINVKLLRNHLCSTILFNEQGKPVPPIDILYKRPIVIMRGTQFDRFDMYSQFLNTALQELSIEASDSKRVPYAIPEVSLNIVGEEKQLDDHQILENIDVITKHNYHVMITAISFSYQLSTYLSRYNKEYIRFAMGLSNLILILQDRFYKELDGGILRAMSDLLAKHLKVYVFDMETTLLRDNLNKNNVDLTKWQLPKDDIASLTNITPKGHMRHLYQYLLETNSLIPLTSPPK